MRSFQIAVLFTLVVVFWASAFVGIRIGLVSYSPGSLVLFRFLIASICLAGFYLNLPEKKSMAWSERWQLMALGLIGVGAYQYCLTYGELTVSAGVAGFIIGFMPVFTVLLAIIFLRERPRAWTYVGMIISFAGLLLMVFAENDKASGRLGACLVLSSAGLAAVYTILGKQLLSRYHPIVLTSWLLWGGTLCFFGFFPSLIQDVKLAKTEATLAVVYLGVFPAAFSYLGFSYLLKHLPASTAAFVDYACPGVAMLMGLVILGERPSLLSLIGGLLALSGAVLATVYREKPKVFKY